MWLLMIQVAASVAAPGVPVDWNVLPELSVQRRWAGDPQLSFYVRDEVRAQRCGSAITSPTGRSLVVDLAVLIGADGVARRIVPRAIGCPTVEQYASGLASRLIRGNVAVPIADGWYRTSIDFAWR